MTTRRAFMQLLGIAGIAPRAVAKPTLSPLAEGLVTSAKTAIGGAGGVLGVSEFMSSDSWIKLAPPEVREALEYIRFQRHNMWQDSGERLRALMEFKSISKAAARTIAEIEHRKYVEERMLLEQMENWINEQFNPIFAQKAGQCIVSREPAPPYNRTSS